ncbi:MAG: hypothetical protein H6732_18600 [Alphaproteobacteria bacterium]|nr:hypothetical protein [Alphaproteobacteria bacterium]
MPRNWFWWGLALIAGWLLLERRTKRSDGELVENLPPYRRMLAYAMPGRNESVVYFDRAVRAEKLEAYLEQAKDKLGANMTHATVAAVLGAFGDNPRMNQFVAGRRLYRRKGVWVTFSMKRQKLNRKAYLAAVKLDLREGETFRELVDRINAKVGEERSGKKTAADKEFDILNLLPRPFLRSAVGLIRVLDYYGLVPSWFIQGDGMFTSMFVANLGSVGMGPGYHHLYEYGTCPLFLMIGKVEDRVIVEDGKPVAARILPLRFSFDERIDDGHNANYGIEAIVTRLEDPFGWLGCLADDGSDVLPIWPHGKHVDQGDQSEYKPPA